MDSSAMLAHLRGEPGGALVTSILGDTTAKVYAHSVNLMEVRYSFGAPSIPGNSQKASAALTQLFASGVQERRDNDGPFFEDVALLIAERRAQPRDPARLQAVPTLALGDAFGIGLSRRLGAPFVTADQSEIVPLQTAGLCLALFIR